MAMADYMRLITSPKTDGAWAKQAILAELERPDEELRDAILILPAMRVMINAGERVRAIGAMAMASHSLICDEEGAGLI